MKFPSDVYPRVKQARDGTGFVWTLQRYGKDLATGLSLTEKKAYADAFAALVDFHFDPKAVEKRKNKGVLFSICRNRPYTICHVLEALNAPDGTPSLEIIERAEQREREIHSTEPVKFRKPLPNPKHHLTKHAGDIAEKTLNAMIGLKYLELIEGRMFLTRAGKAYARRVFPGRFRYVPNAIITAASEPTELVFDMSAISKNCE